MASLRNISLLCLGLIFVLAAPGLVSGAVFQKAIAASTDDGHQYTIGNAVTLDAAIQIRNDAAPTVAGLRFTGVTIPRGAVINSATIQFWGTEAGPGDGNPLTLAITAQASDNAGTFTAAPADISSRARTTASVSWATTVWSAAQHNAGTTTSDIKSVIQEIVNRTGWVDRSAIAIILSPASGAGYRRAESWDSYPGTGGNGSRSAVITIDYTPGGLTNLALGKTAVASSVEGALNAAGAIDGNSGTRWGSGYATDPNRDSAWIYVDLGSAMSFDSVFINWQASAGLQYKIQTANTASTTDAGWTDAAYIVDGVSDENREIVFAPVSARYVRVRGYSRTSEWGYSIWEFGVYSGSVPPAISNISVTNDSLEENQLSGSTIGILSTTGGAGPYTYSLVAGTGSTDNASFSVTGGILKTAAVLSYETKSAWSIRVRSTDGIGGTFDKVLTIIVTDVNDPPSDITLTPSSIAENAASGTLVGTLGSVDDDAGNTHTYTLVTGTGSTNNASFSISGTSLRTAAVFNYENKASYSIRVRSDDGNGIISVALKASNDLYVSVGANLLLKPNAAAVGNSEKFYLINNGDGTYALQAIAPHAAGFYVAADRNLGGTKLIADRGAVSGWESFTLTDNGDGTISFQDGLNNYVSAAEGADSALKANQAAKGISEKFTMETLSNTGYFEKAITISVTNVNEAPTGMALSASTVAENQPIGTAVGTLSSTDPDAGNTFIYSLVAGTGGADNASFSISGSTLQTGAALNFEAKSSYAVRVRTTDQGGVLYYEEAFTITVTDANESPTDIALSTTTIAEKQPVGTAVGTLSASDPDAANTFTYSLVSGTGSTDNGNFSISGSSLQTAAILNFNTQSSHAIRIQVADQGGRTYEEAFTISVSDDPDAPTNITLTLSDSSENLPANSVMGTLSATDPDVGDTHTFTLVSGAGSTDNALFNISGASFRNTSVLNYEAQSAYSVRIRVTDAGGSTYDEAITINIRNVNEAPVNISLSDTSVVENSPSGSFTGQLSASDPDGESNHVYTLAAGTGDTDNGSFTISGDSLLTAAAFDFEGQRTFSLRIRAADPGGQYFEKAFTIAVTDANEAPTALNLAGGILEDGAAAASQAGTFTTIDPEAGNTHTYELVAGTGDDDNAAFSILSDILYTAGPVALIEQSSYSVRVRTTDGGGLSLENTFTISVIPKGDYTVSITVLPDAAAGRTAPAGSFSISLDSSRTVSAIPSDGWIFSGWDRSGGLSVSDETSQQITATLTEASDASLTANFTYSVSQLEVTIPDMLTNISSPGLQGTVNDPFADVSITVDGQTYPAANNGDGTWSLPAGTVAALPEDTLEAVVSVVNALAVTVQDTAVITTDYTSPSLASFSPNMSGTSLIRPTLQMEFSEKVRAGEGQIVLYKAGSGAPIEFFTLPTESQSVSGMGTRQVSLSLSADLDMDGDYYVLISDSCFLDSVGNAYAGIADSTAWRFRTQSADDPVIDSIVTSNPDGWYGEGDSIYFTIHFSRPVELTGGNLRVILETGETDRAVRITPFPLSGFAQGVYIVEQGDSSAALDILLLEPASGASIVSGTGAALIPGIPQGRNLSDYAMLRIDGIAPEAYGLLPGNNDIVLSTLVRFELRENLQALTVSWNNGIKDGVPLGADVRADTSLEGDLLLAGIHEIEVEGTGLDPGTQYEVVVRPTDSAGNEGKTNSLFVLLASGAASVIITPEDTVLEIGQCMQFSARALESGGRSLPGLHLEWSLSGPGEIDTSGWYCAGGLGETRIIAGIDSLADTARVTVNGGEFSLPSAGGGIVVIGSGIELNLPDMTITNTLILAESAVELRPSWMLPAGAAVTFPEARVFEGTQIRLKVNAAAAGEDSARVQAYKYEESSGRWRWIKGEYSDGWITFTDDTLGTYILGIDTQPPTGKWKGIQDFAAAGQDINVSFTAEDDILNPEVRLRVRLGSAGSDSTFLIEFTESQTGEGRIPGSLVDERGLFYTLEIWDGSNRTFLDTVDVEVALGKQQYTGDMADFDGHYGLVSIPRGRTGRPVSELLSDKWDGYDSTRWRLFGYSDEFIEMADDEEIGLGRSYWLRTKDFDKETLSLDSGIVTTLPVSKPFKVPLASGYNCIANPFLFPVPRAQLLQDGETAPYIFQYIGQQWKEPGDVDTLYPWMGYALWNGETGDKVSDTLELFPYSSDSIPLPKRNAAEGTRIRVSVQSGGYIDGEFVLAFGYTGSGDGRDSRDLPKPGMVPQQLSAGIRVPWDTAAQYLTDYRGALENGLSWRMRVASKASGSVDLAFNGLQDLPGGMESVLLDEARGIAVPLAGSGRVDYLRKSANPENFEIAIGTPEFIGEKVKRFLEKFSIFSLSQNYPNPFRNRTTIRYSLPWHEKGLDVRLSIYNIQGRKVAELFHGRREAGQYHASWDGTFSNGAVCPSGTYFAKLEAGGQYSAEIRILHLR